MLVVSWDPSTRIIRVVNGPWPVTRRDIHLSKVEQNRGKNFWLGRLSPL